MTIISDINNLREEELIGLRRFSPTDAWAHTVGQNAVLTGVPGKFHFLLANRKKRAKREGWERTENKVISRTHL